MCSRWGNVSFRRGDVFPREAVAVLYGFDHVHAAALAVEFHFAVDQRV